MILWVLKRRDFRITFNFAKLWSELADNLRS
ncbi:MAG: hypothetical protein ACI84K_001458, partial [Pseudohongiellaceae bacterium]